MKNQIEISPFLCMAAYQKMMLIVTKTTATTAAQNHGRGRPECPSLGTSVAPYTTPAVPRSVSASLPG